MKALSVPEAVGYASRVLQVLVNQLQGIFLNLGFKCFKTFLIKFIEEESDVPFELRLILGAVIGDILLV